MVNSCKEVDTSHCEGTFEMVENPESRCQSEEELMKAIRQRSKTVHRHDAHQVDSYSPTDTARNMCGEHTVCSY